MRKAYLKLARTYHPDKGHANGADIMARISEAYSLLTQQFPAP